MNPTEYYLKIQELTPVETTSPPAVIAPAADFNLLPIVIFLTVFLSGLVLLAVKHLVTIKRAVWIAAFASSVGFVALSTQTANRSTRLDSQASAAAVPKNMSVILEKTPLVTWETDNPTTGGILVSTSPEFNRNRQIIPEINKDWKHSVELPLVKGEKVYYLRIFSGSRWYDNHGSPIVIHLP